MARKRTVTPAQIAAAVAALKLRVPVRAAEWKGKTLLLHTRAGVVRYTPPAGGARAGG